jgi:hypothetical protein
MHGRTDVLCVSCIHTYIHTHIHRLRTVWCCESTEPSCVRVYIDITYIHNIHTYTHTYSLYDAWCSENNRTQTSWATINECHNDRSHAMWGFEPYRPMPEEMMLHIWGRQVRTPTRSAADWPLMCPGMIEFTAKLISRREQRKLTICWLIAMITKGKGNATNWIRNLCLTHVYTAIWPSSAGFLLHLLNQSRAESVMFFFFKIWYFSGRLCVCTYACIYLRVFSTFIETRTWIMNVLMLFDLADFLFM